MLELISEPEGDSTGDEQGDKFLVLIKSIELDDPTEKLAGDALCASTEDIDKVGDFDVTTEVESLRLDIF